MVLDNARLVKSPNVRLRMLKVELPRAVMGTGSPPPPPHRLQEEGLSQLKILGI